MTALSESTATALRKAAEIVETPGRWAKGSLVESPPDTAISETTVDNVACCGVGAVQVASGAKLGRDARRGAWYLLTQDAEVQSHALLAVEDVLRRWDREGVVTRQANPSLVTFNDYQAGTSAEVARLFREAADSLDGGKG